MTISNPNQATHPLPERCWDINPDFLRHYGVVDDFDIEIHAIGERDWDARTAAQCAIDLGLDDRAKDALFWHWRVGAKPCGENMPPRDQARTAR